MNHEIADVTITFIYKFLLLKYLSGPSRILVLSFIPIFSIDAATCSTYIFTRNKNGNLLACIVLASIGMSYLITSMF